MLKHVGGFCLALLILTGCFVAPSPAGEGQADIGAYRVTWRSMIDVQPGVNDHLADVVFSFSWVDPYDSNGVTAADWKREADRLNTTVNILKRAMPRDVFLAKDGTISPCTGFAVERGLCDPTKRKPAVALSVPQRVRLAHKSIVEYSQCRWVGFDPTLHKAFENRTRPSRDLLYVQIDCR